MPLLDTYKFFFFLNWHAFVRQRIYSHFEMFQLSKNVLSVRRKHSHIISDSFVHFDIVFGVLLVSHKPKKPPISLVWVAYFHCNTSVGLQWSCYFCQLNSKVRPNEWICVYSQMRFQKTANDNDDYRKKKYDHLR